jgi:hypothetical protein
MFHLTSAISLVIFMYFYRDLDPLNFAIVATVP